MKTVLPMNSESIIESERTINNQINAQGNYKFKGLQGRKEGRRLSMGSHYMSENDYLLKSPKGGAAIIWRGHYSRGANLGKGEAHPASIPKKNYVHAPLHGLSNNESSRIPCTCMLSVKLS